LVVEVAVWSQRTDLGSKLRHYAVAGIPEYWVIDPHEGVGELTRHTDPEGDGYRTVETFLVGHRASELDVRQVLGAS
jgi:Uma2 family endonuclease